MAIISGGELLLRCLKAEGAKRIFGIPDFAYNPLLYNVEKYGIRWITPRHEAAAVHMAEGVYKTSGEIPVVMAGAGPGTANLVSGIICAKNEGVPVIAITAQRRLEVVYPSMSGVFQGMDQVNVFRPITNWSAPVLSWSRIPEIVRTAYREAMAGRPGPVHIDMSDTIFYATGDEESVTILEPKQYRSSGPEPSRRQVEELASLIVGADNFLVVAGTGVLNADGSDDLLGLIELLNCTATTTMAARSAIPSKHPNYVFGYANGALSARKEADVVLAIGTRLGELDLPFAPYWGDPRKQKIIQVDVDPRNIGANWPIYMGIVADAKETLKELVALLRKMKVKPSNGEKVKYYNKLDEEDKNLLTQDIRNYAGGKIHPAHSVEIAREVFGPDAINVGDGGNTNLYNAFFTTFTNPRTSLGIFEFGHLGTGIPYAIGAKIQNPDKDVYVITGDGAAGFNLMEMETALREHVKITVIIHHEEAWCMEEITQLVEFGDPSKIIGCALSPVRWDKVAEALGCYGEYVDKLDQLPSALKRAKDSNLPAIVCVKTDKQVNLIPPGSDKFEIVYTGPK